MLLRFPQRVSPLGLTQALFENTARLLRDSFWRSQEAV
jgi:hypothetical protein